MTGTFSINEKNNLCEISQDNLPLESVTIYLLKIILVDFFISTHFIKSNLIKSILSKYACAMYALSYLQVSSSCPSNTLF